MIFEDLQENYTKVSYKKQPIVLDISESSMSQIIDWRKVVIRVGITTAFIVLGLDTVAFAESFDKKAEKLYYGKFIEIAMWLIIGKCGWDAVSRALKEDFDGTKRSVIAGLLTFAIVAGLPWAFKEVGSIFF